MTNAANAVALLDANVLYPAGLRDLLLQTAVAGMFQPKWSEQIFAEWMRTDSRVRRNHDTARVRRAQSQMNAALPYARLKGFQRRIRDLLLPDPDDRHILAAAIHGGCGVIVTRNLRDFPAQTLAEYAIEALHPDDFLLALLEQNVDAFLDAARAILARLRNPPYSFNEYLALREQDGLAKTVAALRFHTGRLA